MHRIEPTPSTFRRILPLLVAEILLILACIGATQVAEVRAAHAGDLVAASANR